MDVCNFLLFKRKETTHNSETLRQFSFTTIKRKNTDEIFAQKQ